MPTPKQVLVIRLSSLGDVILSTGAIDLLRARDPSIKIDFLVSSRFIAPLEGDSRIRKLWSFDRSKGLKGWIELIGALKKVEYDQVIDLQQSLRTLLLFFLFLGTRTRFSVLRKDRNRSQLFFFFKSLLPRFLRPRRRALLMARAVDRKCARIHTHLACSPKPKYIGIMPSSAHQGKEWPLESWLTLLQNLHLKLPKASFLILGKEGTLSEKLLEACLDATLSVTSAIETPTLDWIPQLKTLLCVDTGLLHWAEACNIPVFALFGPTHPDLGFGPLLATSQSILKPTWCQPCSFSGKYCFRFDKPYTCLRDLSPTEVSEKAIHFIRGLP